jgi:hypothetical protein
MGRDTSQHSRRQCGNHPGYAGTQMPSNVSHEFWESIRTGGPKGIGG